jgi:hypothetical protein
MASRRGYARKAFHAALLPGAWTIRRAPDARDGGSRTEYDRSPNCWVGRFARIPRSADPPVHRVAFVECAVQRSECDVARLTSGSERERFARGPNPFFRIRARRPEAGNRQRQPFNFRAFRADVDLFRQSRLPGSAGRRGRPGVRNRPAWGPRRRSMGSAISIRFPVAQVPLAPGSLPDRRTLRGACHLLSPGHGRPATPARGAARSVEPGGRR